VYCNFFSRHVKVPESDDTIRLGDDAFSRICNALTDLAVHVRQLAASLLGSMTFVSPKFLEQTLDKKLMSDMRVSENCVSSFFLLFIAKIFRINAR